MEHKPTPRQGFSSLKLSSTLAVLSIEELDVFGNPYRQRRKHSKSKAGCDSCKAKRIKVRSPKRISPTYVDAGSHNG